MLFSCPAPGCGRISDKRRCPEHRKRKATAKRRATYGVGPRGAAWRKLSAEYLRTHPYCECDDPACMLPSEQVHHVDGQGATGERGLDPTNLLALSASCHAALEAKQRQRGQEGRWA
jgi:5-methylcytosine-specific restriction protein A